DGRGFTLDARFEIAVDRLDEVLRVKARVEAENRAAEHAVEDFLAPWTDAERFRIRPRDVPEGDDGGLRQPLADEPRQQREVVVLHQHHGIVSAGLGLDRVGEASVDAYVLLPVRRTE